MSALSETMAGAAGSVANKLVGMLSGKSSSEDDDWDSEDWDDDDWSDDES